MAEAPVARRLVHPPEGLVDLAELIPDLQLDLRYSTSHNFTGAPLAGYEAQGAWLTQATAHALSRAADLLRTEDRVSLVIYDAYRPLRATRAMVAWCTASGRDDLLRGYISATSRHGQGIAVDVGLFSPSSGQPLDLGCDFDTFTDAAHPQNATGEILRWRLQLAHAMQRAGFEPYSREWWHFELPGQTAPVLDVPYSWADSCQESITPR